MRQRSRRATTITPAIQAQAMGRRAGAAVTRPDAMLPELAEAESESYSSTISRSSIARSFMDCSRWSGLLARQRRINRRSSAGACGLSSSTGLGFSWRILCMVSTPVSAANGRWCVAAS